MTTWYQVSRYGSPEIKAVEVLKETAGFVTIKTSWMGRESSSRHRKSDEFWPTFEAAQQSLLDRYDRAIKHNRDAYSTLLSHRKAAQELTQK